MSQENGSKIGKEAGKDFKFPAEIKREGIPAFVANWTEKVFGFLRVPGEQKDIFCHVNEMCIHLKPKERGGKVERNREVFITSISADREDRKSACGVKCAECAEMPRWELRPSTKQEDTIFGVTKMVPVCLNKRDASFYAGQDTIPQAAIDQANRPFSEAQQKKYIWESSLTPDFFDSFGEPQEIKVLSEDKVEMRFTEPYGAKIVTSREVFNSGRWEANFTGETKRDESCLYCECAFKDIPGTKNWAPVAVFYNAGPELCDSFDRLPETVKSKVLVELKKDIKAPEVVAEERFLSLLETSEYIRKANAEIRELQTPGELHTEYRSSIQSVYEPLSPDERRGGRSYDEKVTNGYLICGARKIGRSGQSGNYTGGHRFSMDGIRNGGSLEQIRQELIASRRNEIDRWFALDHKIFEIKGDPRLYDLTKEEWKERFEKKWSELVAAKKAEWEAEETSDFDNKKREWDEYEVAANELEKAESRVSALGREADKLLIRYNYSDGPRWVEYGAVSLADIRKNTEEINVYADKLEGLIQSACKERGERVVAEADLQREMEQPAAPAMWYLNNINPAEFEKRFGRKQGEGFGERVAGQDLYLPGDRGVVGMFFGATGRNRASTTIETSGLSSLLGGSLPESVGKRTDVSLMALITDKNWNVRWTEKFDGAPHSYHIANEKGFGHLSINKYNYGETIEVEELYSCCDWNNVEGSGPSEQELRSAFGLPARIASVKGEIANQVQEIKPAEEVAPKKEETTTFKDEGKRYFKCACGCMERISSGEMVKYNAGEIIKITCAKCKKSGEVSKK